jgi:hypothetical protein
VILKVKAFIGKQEFWVRILKAKQGCVFCMNDIMVENAVGGTDTGIDHRIK